MTSSNDWWGLAWRAGLRFSWLCSRVLARVAGKNSSRDRILQNFLSFVVEMKPAKGANAKLYVYDIHVTFDSQKMYTLH